MDIDFIKESQQQVLQNIGKATQKLVQLSNIFSYIGNYSNDVIELALGRLGKSLCVCSRLIDNQHPAVSRLFNGIFLESSDFFRKVIEALKVANYSKEQNLQIISQSFNRNLNADYENLNRILNSPPVSILKDPLAVAMAREIVRTRIVDLSNASFDWSTTLPSFNPYIRLGEGFVDEIRYHERILSRFQEIGAILQAESLAKQISQLKAASNDNYCGFMRMTILQAAIKLAKLNNFSFVPSVESYHIIVPSEKVGNILDSQVNFLYTPRVYPLSKCPLKRTKVVQDILNILEHHPDCDGKPFFDHYYIVVPSINLPATKNSEFVFFNGKEVKKYFDYWSCHKALDAFLFESGKITPVILGENVVEKACYFIGFWTLDDAFQKN